mmetsp:Transcript_78947/g.223429  ORF Transcript_78947/g.223429 Transcript_78947/m.223429 type:complete len:286 (-) Transcript_78947:174-1031(-)
MPPSLSASAAAKTVSMSSSVKLGRSARNTDASSCRLMTPLPSVSHSLKTCLTLDAGLWLDAYVLTHSATTPAPDISVTSFSGRAMVMLTQGGCREDMNTSGLLQPHSRVRKSPTAFARCQASFSGCFSPNSWMRTRHGAVGKRLSLAAVSCSCFFQAGSSSLPMPPPPVPPKSARDWIAMMSSLRPSLSSVASWGAFSRKESWKSRTSSRATFLAKFRLPLLARRARTTSLRSPGASPAAATASRAVLPSARTKLLGSACSSSSCRTFSEQLPRIRRHWRKSSTE